MKRIHKIGIILFLFVSLLCTSWGQILFNLISLSKEQSEMTDGNVFISLQSENNPTLLPDTMDSIEKYKKFNNILIETAESTDSSYYEIYRQPLRLQNGAEGELKCVQISDNVQYDFSIDIENGRLLSTQDYYFKNGNIIPVLIGTELDSLYEIGDTFEAEYLFYIYQFVVVGELKQGSYITTGTDKIVLDRYILMPSFNLFDIPQNADQYACMKIHYANKASGYFVCSNENFDICYQEILHHVKETTIDNFSVRINSNEKQMELKGVSLETAFLMSVILLIISSALLFVTAKKYIIEIKTHTPLITTSVVVSIVSCLIQTFLCNILSFRFQPVPIILYLLIYFSVFTITAKRKSFS